MNNILKFLGRYWWLIILAVLLGNTIVWKKNQITLPAFESKLKIKTKGQYYDYTRQLLTTLSDSTNWKTNNTLHINKVAAEKIASMHTSSYRNEDVYILELNVLFSDSTGYAKVMDTIAAHVHQDLYLKDHVFNRLKFIDKLLQKGQELEKIIYGSNAEYGVKEHTALQNELTLFDINWKMSSSQFDKETLLKEFEILSTNGYEITYKEVSKLRPHLIATVLFLIIGFFLSVLLDQVRSKP